MQNTCFLVLSKSLGSASIDERCQDINVKSGGVSFKDVVRDVGTKGGGVRRMKSCVSQKGVIGLLGGSGLKGNLLLGRSKILGPRKSKMAKVKVRKAYGGEGGSDDSIRNSPPEGNPKKICAKAPRTNAHGKSKGKECQTVVHESASVYESLNDSAMERGNKRFWEAEEKKVAEEAWKIIAELGVVGDKSDEVYVEAIQAMEVRDGEGRKARLEKQN